MRKAALFLPILLVSCGPSAQELANIRLAASAYQHASDTLGKDKDAMDQLQKAIDIIPDSPARTEFVRCQQLLALQGSQYSLIQSDLELNLTLIGHGQESTKNDFDRAMRKATTKYPPPDLNPVAQCDVGFMKYRR